MSISLAGMLLIGLGVIAFLVLFAIGGLVVRGGSGEEASGHEEKKGSR